MTARELIFVAGARPNFMKIAPIFKAFPRIEHPFKLTLVHTGQHYDEAMSDVFFRQLEIPAPDVSLGVGSGTHAEQTGRTLIEFEKLLLSKQKDEVAAIVVVGDVNSTIACALAAAKLGIPICHVEAGLRSFDRRMPEEVNRVLTDAISDLLFVTEESGMTNLQNEGVASKKVHLVGNVMIDTLLQQLPTARELDVRTSLGVGENYALATIHRPSNVDDPARLSQVVRFIGDVARDIQVVFPIHPRTRERMSASGQLEVLAAMNVVTAPPLGYQENLNLMAGARVVISDSGGIQEETTALGVPCLTLRDTTERPSTTTLGTSTLVGNDLELARSLVASVLDGTYKKGTNVPMWDGHAGDRIVSILSKELGHS